jgi:hypothetical protein
MRESNQVWLSGLGSKKLSGKEQGRGENMSCVPALRGRSSFFSTQTPRSPRPNQSAQTGGEMYCAKLALEKLSAMKSSNTSLR